jgi:hypothetical protein
VIFTELAIQSAYFRVQHDMLVTVGFYYILLQFLFYVSFNSNLNISFYFILNDVVVNECWFGKDVIVV